MIGVLDWGIGGLFAVRRMLMREPRLDLAFLSDSGNTPYGRQTRAQLRTSVRRGVERLRTLGAGPILVACHSASTVLPELDLPEVTGVIRPETVPVGGTILVLGGVRTVRSGLWRAALNHHGTVIQRIAQPLSAAVEAGQIRHPTTEQTLQRILAPGRSADTVVLACTHYAALSSMIQAQMPRARIVDPALALADRMPLPQGSGIRLARTTGSISLTHTVAARLLPSVSCELRFSPWPERESLSLSAHET
jgi:glutamate racemase